MTLDHKDVEILTPTAKIIYESFSMPSFVSNRDFVYLYTIREYSDKKIVISSRSITRDDYPETKKFVRGLLLHSGFVIVPINENSCTLHYFIHVDPKGWIPGFLVCISTSSYF